MPPVGVRKVVIATNIAGVRGPHAATQSEDRLLGLLPFVNTLVYSIVQRYLVSGFKCIC